MTTLSARASLPLPEGSDYVTRLEHNALVNAIDAIIHLRTTGERPFHLDPSGVAYNGGANRLDVTLGAGRVMNGGDYPTGVVVQVPNPQPNTDYWISITPNGASSTFPATTSAPAIATSVWLYKIHTPASLAGGTYVVTDLRAELAAEAYVRLKAYVDAANAAEAAARAAADSTELAARQSADASIITSIGLHVNASSGVHGTDSSGVASKSYVDTAVAGVGSGGAVSLTTHRTANPIDHPAGSVTSGIIAANAVQNQHVANGALSGAKLTAGTVGPAALTSAVFPFTGIATGSNPATVGQIRTSPGQGLTSRKATDNTEITLISEETGAIVVGDGGVDQIRINAGITGSINLLTGGAGRLNVSAAGLNLGGSVIRSNVGLDTEAVLIGSYANNGFTGTLRLERRTGASGGFGSANVVVIAATILRGLYLQGPNDGAGSYAHFEFVDGNISGTSIPVRVNGALRYIQTSASP
jgi:hypothetical protein